MPKLWRQLNIKLSDEEAARLSAAALAAGFKRIDRDGQVAAQIGAWLKDLGEREYVRLKQERAARPRMP